jgi:uncharacterized membrane protein YhaH (DUF805 family)
MPLSQLLFSFSGRLNRKPYWLTTLAMIAVLLVAAIVVMIVAGGAMALSGNGSSGLAGLGLGIILVLIIIYIPLLWIGLSLGAKRLHDRNKSAWWLVLFWLVPGVLQGVGEQVGTIGLVLSIAAFAISIWGLVEIGFLRGTVGPNQYGPDPLEGQA